MSYRVDTEYNLDFSYDHEDPLVYSDVDDCEDFDDWYDSDYDRYESYDDYYDKGY